MATDDAAEYYLNLFALTKKATGLVPSGHEIAREQFKISGDYYARNTAAQGQLQVTKDSNRLRFTSGNVRGEFDLRQGRFISYAMDNNRSMISSFPEPYFWRAPTDNDFGNQMQVNLGIWRTAHVNREIKSVKVGEQSNEGIP
jgi:beta-galactosidase